MRTLGVTYLLSPEQITQCDRTSFGCGGGWTESAYKYVQNTGGLELEADYPYTSYNGVTGSCSSTASKFKVIVSGFKTLSYVVILYFKSKYVNVSSVFSFSFSLQF